MKKIKRAVLFLTVNINNFNEKEKQNFYIKLRILTGVPINVKSFIFFQNS